MLTPEVLLASSSWNEHQKRLIEENHWLLQVTEGQIVLATAPNLAHILSFIALVFDRVLDFKIVQVSITTVFLLLQRALEYKNIRLLKSLN